MPLRFLPRHEYVVLAPKERQSYYKMAAKRDGAEILLFTLSEMKSLWDEKPSPALSSYLKDKGFTPLMVKALVSAFASPFFHKNASLLPELQPYQEDYAYALKQGWLRKPENNAASLFVGKEIVISGYFSYGDIISAYLGSLRGDMRIGYELEPNEPISFGAVEVYSNPENEERAASLKALTLSALGNVAQPIICFGFHPVSFPGSHAKYRANPLLMPGETGIWVHAKNPKTPRKPLLFLETTWNSLGILTLERQAIEKQERYRHLLHSGQLASVSLAEGERPNVLFLDENIPFAQNQK